MKCPECGNRKFRESKHTLKYVVDDIVFHVDCLADACTECPTKLIKSAEMGKAELLVAKWLVSNNVMSGRSFRFMRDALMFRATEVADLLGVTNESISRWENGKRPVDRSAWILLAQMVLQEAGDRTTSTLELLRALQRPAPDRKEVRIEAPSR